MAPRRVFLPNVPRTRLNGVCSIDVTGMYLNVTCNLQPHSWDRMQETHIVLPPGLRWSGSIYNPRKTNKPVQENQSKIITIMTFAHFHYFYCLKPAALSMTRTAYPSLFACLGCRRRCEMATPTAFCAGPQAAASQHAPAASS